MVGMQRRPPPSKHLALVAQRRQRPEAESGEDPGSPKAVEAPVPDLARAAVL